MCQTYKCSVSSPCQCGWQAIEIQELTNPPFQLLHPDFGDSKMELVISVYRPTQQLRSSSDTFILCYPSLCTRTCLVRYLFSYPELSGTVSLAKLDHQAHSCLLKHLGNLTSSSSLVCVCVRLCVCVCVCVRVCSRTFVLTVFCSLLCSPIWRTGT